MCHSFLCSISTVVGSEPRSSLRPFYTMRCVLVSWGGSAWGGSVGAEGSVTIAFAEATKKAHLVPGPCLEEELKRDDS